MSSNLIQCIYASAAVRPMDTTALLDMLSKCRRKNEGMNITGVLLHVEGSFFQVLEGTEHEVDALFTHIARDPRHEQVTLIIRERIVARTFKDWSMGLFNVSRDELCGILGAGDFFSAGQSMVALDASRATKILNGFRQGRWRKKVALAEEALPQ